MNAPNISAQEDPIWRDALCLVPYSYEAEGQLFSSEYFGACVKNKNCNWNSLGSFQDWKKSSW